MTRPIVALMGLRASGKTTLGRALAERLERPFIDLDDRTLALLGDETIADAFRRAGEPAFRRAEAEALAAALTEAPCVLALGGGTPTAPGAESALRDAQARRDLLLCYLACHPATLRARLEAAGGAGANRPSLTGDDPLDEIERVHTARDGAYRALADVVVEEPASVEEVLDAVGEG